MYYIFGNSVKRADILKSLKISSGINESFLRLIIETSREGGNIDGAMEAAASLSDSHDPLLQDIDILNDSNTIEKIDKIVLSRFITSGSDKLRTLFIDKYKLRSLTGEETGTSINKSLTDDDIQLLLFLFGESDSLGIEVIEALCLNIDDVSWFRKTVDRWFLLRNHDSDQLERLAEAAYGAASILKSEKYIPEFIKLFRNDNSRSYIDDDKIMDVLEDLLKANPQSKFLFLRADDPDKVKKAYRLNVKDDYNFDRDNKLESARLILLALGKQADPGYAKANAGKTVSISHENDHIDPALTERSLTKEEFEKLAVYLSVTYTDDKSGLIFAEVMDPSSVEPTGEIINAILQSATYAVFTVSWC
jgi:hypothetical protein